MTIWEELDFIKMTFPTVSTRCLWEAMLPQIRLRRTSETPIPLDDILLGDYYVKVGEEKMLNIISAFILWFRKIFHIRIGQKYEEKEPPTEVLPKKKPIEVTPPSEKKSARVILAKGKPEESLSVEEKPVEVPASGERPPEIPSEKEIVETKPPEEKTLEAPPNQKIPSEFPPKASEEIPTVESEEGGKTKTRKPYRKKTPTKERKKERREPSEDEKKPPIPKQRKEIDLGGRHAKRTKRGKTPQPDEKDKVNKKREVTTRVESPFVEIDLDEAKIFLILPKQQFKPSTVSNIPQQLNYKLELNGEEQSISVKVSNDDQGTAKVEEKRIELERPLKNFQVVFPDELQGGPYSYNHSNETLYGFVAIGNNRGRMHYLYDKEGDINSIPKRDVWILLNEDFELKTEPDVIEETWIWEKYQPFRVNLKKMNELIIKNTKTSKEKILPCEPTFSVEGEVIEDDFKDQMPLLIGKTLKVKAPRKNPSGWIVWIQNKVAGYQIVTDNWNGAEPLTLKLPDDIPGECGEFQVDICQQDTRIPDETLFFRWLPFIELDYPKELIIPNPHQGHKSEFIKVKVSGEGWVLSYGADRKVEPIEYNSYQIELLPEEDITCFSITKKSKPETDTRFRITIPRLKWRTSKQKVWNGKLQKIEKKGLIPGEPHYLFVCTNDFDNKYDLLAALEANGRKLQEAKFVRKGIDYNLELNQFYDTMKQNKNEITLKIKIWKAEDKLVSNVEVLQFPGVKELIKKNRQEKPRLIFPKPIVKASLGKKRSGNGFSRQEIIAAGIDIDNIHRLTIPFDKRRKTKHDWNIKTLKSIIEGGKHAH